ncbi:3-deoxy-D-manno-octulosonic acid transferase [Candidatus Magnetomonas plexicatena]|uniref:3-deoxy-D-manno-octulosonic acid transferase n=1 Tax=Candidatus Magnetomonas plexicatena TaxID=2552947 RepID=UPI001C78E21D|nr:3-deoxy-D-manno-octulosonic acid transferase [Nitrospirales bacterium LBB_01]
MMFIYRLLYFAAFLLLLPYQFLKRASGLRGKWFMERAGKYGFVLKKPGSRHTAKDDVSVIDTAGKPVVWVHAVSVGETVSAVPLIKKITEEITPHVVLSTVTDTGQNTAAERLGRVGKVVYMPFDTPACVRRAIETINPDLFIVMETELWPEVFHQMSERKIPVMLLNGRISDKSFRGYKKIRFFMKEIFSKISFFGMQSEVYSERVIKLGARPDKVHTFGNFKFDVMPSKDIPDWATKMPQPLIVMGSTHEGEERLILSCYNKLKTEFATLSLIIAPRHPERFKDVERILISQHTEYQRRTKLNGTQSDVVLVDTIGELSSLYGAADIAIVGGSFLPKGGHNLLEPAFWEKPIVTGPFMDNFPMAEDFFETGAAIQADSSDLCETLRELLKNPARSAEMGRKAGELFRKNAGSIDLAVNEIKTILKNKIAYL